MSPGQASFLAFSDERKELALTCYPTGTAIAPHAKEREKLRFVLRLFNKYHAKFYIKRRKGCLYNRNDT